MPELPEVEVVRLGLSPHVVGCKITNIVSCHQKLRLPLPKKKLGRWVVGARVVALERRAKYLLFQMDNGALLVFHLGMTGNLGLFSKALACQKHDHLRLQLDSGNEIRFNDTRRFGSVQVFTKEELEKTDPFADLGPEPFWNEFSPDYLIDCAARRTQPVKNFLMDNRVVVGIGNIYANEILFAAGINPVTPANSLTQSQWKKVVSESHKVLNKAIACGGTTISDFVNPDGKQGYFQCELKVYGRSGEPCRQCKTVIIRTVMAGRATYHCPHCQR